MSEIDRIQALVARELMLVDDPARRDALRARLVKPRLAEREWGYGAPGERYPYWIVAEALERGIILVYCEQGFGPEMPWGFLFTDEPGLATLGMDSQWDWYLEGAFVRSALWGGEVRRDEAFHHPPEERFLEIPPRDA